MSDSAGHPQERERERIGDLEETVRTLEGRLRSAIEDRDRYREQVIQPELGDLREDSDDAREQRVEVREQLTLLQKEVTALRADAKNWSAPRRRAATLRGALIDRAANATGRNAGKASMYYQEIQECFADHGHGTVHRAECMTAMEDAADADGFSIGTKTSQHGNEVKAVRVDIDALPAGTACRDSTTRDRVGGGPNALISDRNTSEDSY